MVAMRAASLTSLVSATTTSQALIKTAVALKIPQSARNHARVAMGRLTLKICTTGKTFIALAVMLLRYKLK